MNINNMTPHEKANELVNMFMTIKPVKMDDYTTIYFPTAKLCALHVVEEILAIDCYDMSEEHFDKHIEYWESVKEEIDNL